MVATWSMPGEQGEEDSDKTIPKPDLEEVAAIVILDDDDADLPIDIPPAVSMSIQDGQRGARLLGNSLFPKG